MWGSDEATQKHPWVRCAPFPWQSSTAPDVWVGPALAEANGAGPLAEDGTLSTQNASIQTDVSVAGQLRLLLTRCMALR